MAPTRTGASSALPGSILLVVHDFIARSPDELSLAKGDRIELIERFLGKHLTNGQNGLFPEVYTTPAPRGTHTGSASAIRVQSDGGSRRAAPSAVAGAAPPWSTSASSTLSSTSNFSTPTPGIVRSSLPSSTFAGNRNFTVATDSPVMSETLSVINEHITDMHSPRHNQFPTRDTRDKQAARQSFIAGHETDEEELQSYTEEDVLGWTPERVAEYLEDRGVEKSHCEVFKEQEISGEVLLAMDQNSLFIKEFELGSVGRRLKTWHKVKALQDEVKQNNNLVVTRSVSEYSAGFDLDDIAASGADPGRKRTSTLGANSAPRVWTAGHSRDSSRNGAFVPVSTAKAQEDTISPLQSMTSMSRLENTYRPSAQVIRNLGHARRHSSIDSTTSDISTRKSHRKKPSLETSWQPGQPAQTHAKHGHSFSTDIEMPTEAGGSAVLASPENVDRGYFSSTETDSRHRRSVLTKRQSAIAASPGLSKDSSERPSYQNTRKLSESSHFSRTSGHEEPTTPGGTPISSREALKRVMELGFGGYRGSPSSYPISPVPNIELNKPNVDAQPAISPIVTKLDPGPRFSPNAATASPKVLETASDASSEKATPSDKATPGPYGLNMSMFSTARSKIPGFRSISDAVTKEEKTAKPVASPTRTGSSTPSTEHQSIDLSKSDHTSRTSAGSANNLMPPPPTKRPRVRTKKSTSAYTRGLEKKTPAEQMVTCDYSGWMKKKSGSLMSTWKPRLFILRGRRLSYYYTDDDTEEKGLIDISFHRVLPAQNEALTGLHAAVTGAAGTQGSPTQGSTPTIAEQDLRDHPPQKGEAGDEGLFIFKLVPPKAGLAKGVNFTKPTVHYFAVNSRQEGRLWMAALMKATIDRDDTSNVTTTYNQKTISLATARARRERPPALKEAGVDGDAESTVESTTDAGLGIDGIVDQSPTVAGADNEEVSILNDNLSIPQLPSVATSINESDNEALTQHERMAFAALSTP